MSIADGLLAYGALTTAVFAVVDMVKGAPGFRSVPPRWLGVILGMAFSTALTATGFIDIPQVDGGAELASAALLGFLAFALAHVVHKIRKVSASL